MTARLPDSDNGAFDDHIAHLVRPFINGEREALYLQIRKKLQPLKSSSLDAPQLYYRAQALTPKEKIPLASWAKRRSSTASP